MFNFIKTTLVSALLLITTVSFAGQANILEVAEKAGDFKTLLTAIKVANLTSTLEGKGPFTVFAPTDKAFSALPKATLDQLLKDPKALAAVLTYHVIAGEISSKDVKTGDVQTVNGQDVHLNVSNKGVTINGANVIKADIDASNGIIHVIDKVLIPAS